MYTQRLVVQNALLMVCQGIDQKYYYNSKTVRIAVRGSREEYFQANRQF